MKATYELEKNIITNAIITLLLLLVVQIAMTFLFYKNIPEYADRYFLPLLYVPVAIVATMAALWHQRAYNARVTCMTGMMIGMTIGMTTGFTLGAIVGLINGMFVGSLVGIIAAIIAGVYAGRCCGIMGMMEGMMAALMGGLMGAMTTNMVFGMQAQILLPFLLVFCVIILAGLIVVVIKEYEGETIDAKPWPFSVVLILSLGIMVVISAIILFSPKGLY